MSTAATARASLPHRAANRPRARGDRYNKNIANYVAQARAAEAGAGAGASIQFVSLNAYKEDELEEARAAFFPVFFFFSPVPLPEWVAPHVQRAAGSHAGCATDRVCVCV